ncbi:MAG: glycosyltransferase family 2 protein [Bradyrhizobiaceae bacterium]|nr:glycosyltransferase family 2 protein [Bradyrhizobiaceae bacterium]
MIDQPDISVVLTTYNRRQSLPRAIGSVLAQEDVDFELIVVDDASTDDTQSYLATLTDPRIKVLATERNIGPSAARNIGIEAARADVVAFLDSDDAYRPGRLKSPLAALADPAIVCVVSSSLTATRDKRREARIPDVKLEAPALEWALTCDLFPVESSGMTVRRAEALAVGGFCPALRFAEDRELLIRLSRLGGGQLLSEVLWEKSWSVDGLSNDWSRHGFRFLTFVSQRPEYLTRFRRLGSYFAVKVLEHDLRAWYLTAFWRDLRAFCSIGLIDVNLWHLFRNHRQVGDYRRSMSKGEALVTLVGPPDAWP